MRAPSNVAKVQMQLLRLVTPDVPFWILTNPLFARLAVWISGLVVIPNFMQAIGFRKLYMEQQVRSFCARLPQQHRKYWFQRRSGDLPWRCPLQPAFVAADLTQMPLSNPLVEGDDQSSSSPSSYFDSSKPTIAILEVLLFYLEEDHVRQLFNDLVEVTPPNSSRIALDYFSLDANGNYSNGWLTSVQSRVVARLGEKYHWAIEPSKLEASFASQPVDIERSSAKNCTRTLRVGGATIIKKTELRIRQN